MKAAVCRELNQPLSIEEVDKPVPGPGDVVIRLEASGLCHTDIHAVHGDWPIPPRLPLIPGHEGVGIVEDVGDGVRRVSEGDRVALVWLASACGHCRYCVEGEENLCLRQRNAGYNVDGSHAEYARGRADYVGIVPDGVDPFDAAPLSCAGLTTYKAVKASGIRPSQLIAVFGVGGLGHLALQYAKVFGASVVAVDLLDDKLALARELGADYTVNAREADPVEEIKKLGFADAAISVATAPQAFEQAYRSLRRGGTMMFVALPPDNTVELPIFETVTNGITVKGSIVGTRQDLEEVYDLHADGRTRVVYERSKLDNINEDIEAVVNGRVAARRVFEF